ncbi:ABC transporter permease [Bacillus alkalicola]|uniref:ABC transporter permease n=1 Tax=Evansella alkalicola TaxID=745819 RepID=A0ABS6JXN3_9BACI|nr:ABC transporter permease [Bacillus alkalicola]
MNIVNRLTLRHLKENKRRTLVTIIGTIISVAMVTAVATLAVSFLDLMQRGEIENSGEWHVQFNEVNASQIDELRESPLIDDLFIQKDSGFSLLEGSQQDYRPYLFIKNFSEGSFDRFPISIVEGRLPENNGEIIVSREIEAIAGVKFDIGEEIVLEIGDRYSEIEDIYGMDDTFSFRREDGENKETLENITAETFTVVGVMERPNWETPWSPGYTVISYLDEGELTPDTTVRASVIFEKLNRSFYENAEKLAEDNQISLEQVNYNRNLLMYYGVSRNEGAIGALYGISGVIITIIIIGSVALIYNAFAISVSERSRHLGMLSSVGATKRQKRNSVFFEGAVIGLISIPIGIISGIGGIAVTFTFINSIMSDIFATSEKLETVVTSGSILTACIISIITIFISTYLPARKASKISAIDAIRQTTDVKLSRKAVKTSKIVRKLFGMEAEIGLKNLKRNKRKYKVTVFSLVISIILFLSVSYFTHALEKSTGMWLADINYDIQVYLGEDLTAEDELIVEAITQLEDITEFSKIKRMSLSSWVEEEKVSDPLLEMDDGVDHEIKGPEEEYYYQITIHGFNDAYLEEYSEVIGADLARLNDPAQLGAIIIDTISYQDWDTGQFVETDSIKLQIGDTIDLYHIDWHTEDATLMETLETEVLTDIYPMGVGSRYPGTLDIIVSDQVFQELVHSSEEIQMEVSNYLYINSSDPTETHQQIDELITGSMSIYNYHEMREQDGQFMLIMSIFVYGFIVLITLISVANIFNTISTSISLRKREFAMLKSVGMTPKSFRKMIHYESIFYGIKSLLYGLPISIGIMYLMYYFIADGFSFGFDIPWGSIIIVIIAVFSIVSVTMLYSTSKVRKENIIDTLKQENI